MQKSDLGATAAASIVDSKANTRDENAGLRKRRGSKVDTQSNNELRGCNCHTKLDQCVTGFGVLQWGYNFIC